MFSRWATKQTFWRKRPAFDADRLHNLRSKMFLAANDSTPFTNAHAHIFFTSNVNTLCENVLERRQIDLPVVDCRVFRTC